MSKEQSALENFDTHVKAAVSFNQDLAANEQGQAKNENEKTHKQDGQESESIFGEGYVEYAKEHHETIEQEEKDVFSEILDKNMGDHDQIGFYDVFHIGLPKIFIDDGIHFYANAESMEEAGLFTTVDHNIVRASNNEAPALDMSVTSLVVFEWIAMIILFVMFKLAGRKYKKSSDAPTGIQNLVEFYVEFVKESIVRPNVGSDRLTNSLSPYFIGLFFFILIMNLLGLVPGGHSPSGNLAVTAGLAIIAFLVINFVSVKEIGIVNYLKHLLGGAPVALAPIMIPIEILSMFTKPFALTVRLFANMTAGHVILLCLVGLIFFFKTIFMAFVAVPFSIFIYLLELLVAFIQAYVFTILTAVFVGLALGDHAHDDHTHDTHGGLEHQH